jgi:hypothetical protein
VQQGIWEDPYEPPEFRDDARRSTRFSGDRAPPAFADRLLHRAEPGPPVLVRTSVGKPMWLPPQVVDAMPYWRS